MLYILPKLYNSVFGKFTIATQPFHFSMGFAVSPAPCLTAGAPHVRPRTRSIWRCMGAQCAPLRYNMCQSFNAVRRVVAPYDICNIKHEKGKPSFLFTLRKLLTSVFHLIPTPANKKRKAQRLPLSNFLYYCSLKCTSPVSASMPSTIASDSS